MTIAEFIRKYINTSVDFDGAFGAQCVDLFRQYCKDVWNLPHTGSVEGAKDLVLNYKNLPKEKEYLVCLKPTAKIKCGDVVVWGATPTNKYGHVAILIAEIDDDFLVLEQNGFAQDGTKTVIRSRNNVIGFLRKKE